MRVILVDRDSSKGPRLGRWGKKLEYDYGEASHPCDAVQCRLRASCRVSCEISIQA